MAEQEAAPEVVEEVEDDENPNYKPPAPKALDDIVNADAEDESLRKYKETLLGKSASEKIVLDESKERVMVKRMELVIEGRDNMCLDLTKSPEDLKDIKFCLKEGCHYKIKIVFNVQKEIVTGLRYHHTVHRKGIRVDKISTMIGSYGPNTKEYEYFSAQEEAPKGMLMRGEYKIKSKFEDDDKYVYANWEWNLCIQKDW